MVRATEDAPAGGKTRKKRGQMPLRHGYKRAGNPGKPAPLMRPRLYAARAKQYANGYFEPDEDYDENCGCRDRLCRLVPFRVAGAAPQGLCAGYRRGRVAQLNARVSPIQDAEIEAFLAQRKLDLTAVTDAATAMEGAMSW